MMPSFFYDTLMRFAYARRSLNRAFVVACGQREMRGDDDSIVHAAH